MKLFTYGTLMDGMSRHEMIKALGGVYLGDYTTCDKFHLVHLTDYKWPAAVELHPDCAPMEDWPAYHIKGELYELPEDVESTFNAMEVGYSKLDLNFQRVDDDSETLGQDIEEGVMYAIREGMFPWYIGDTSFSLYDGDADTVEWSVDGPGTDSRLLQFEVPEEEEETSEVVPIGAAFEFSMAESIPANILESAVVTVAKDEYTGTTVDGFTQYYQRNLVRLAAEARYWYEVLAKAHMLAKVDQD